MAWDGLKLESCVSVLSPCAQSMAGFRLLAAWSALGLTQTRSLCSLHTLSARWFVCTRRIWAQSVRFEEKMVHAASQDAKMLIGSAGRMPVCHPLLPPYAVAQMLIHMLQPVTLCVCDYVCFSSSSFTEEYNTSIQEKLPLIIGSAAAGLVFLIAVVVIIIVCNRWVSPVSVPSSHRPNGPHRLAQETFRAFKPCSEVVPSLKCLFGVLVDVR